MGSNQLTTGTKRAILSLIALLSLPTVSAHCPLCTMGAAVAAGGALWLGVSRAVVGLFLGAFAVSMGWWIAKMIKRQYFPHQSVSIVTLSFLTTALPVLPFLKSGTPADYYPVYLSIAGAYGSLLNRTYLIPVLLASSILGGIIVCCTPWLSRKITIARGRMIPFQGVLLTLSLLSVIAMGMQLLGAG